MPQKDGKFQKGVNSDDPIAVLQKLDTVCAGMNPAV
jgi:hypothetical protein